MIEDQPLEVGTPITIRADEAQHAVRVRRLVEGDSIEMLDGRGGLATAAIERIERLGRDKLWSLTVRIQAVDRIPQRFPTVEVCGATPKGSHLEEMIDGLSQIGCAGWRPLVCEHTVVEPRKGKLDRLERVTRESAKQCGRPWLLKIGEPISFHDAIKRAHDTITVLAHADGRHASDALAADARAIRLLVGPEGGFSEREITLACASGIPLVRLGRHIMRIEVAAVVGAALLVELAEPRHR